MISEEMKKLVLLKVGTGWVQGHEPSGMPHLSSKYCDFSPSIKADCVRFLRYDRNQSRAVPQIENLESSLLSRISWSTVSKVADRSSTKSITQRRL